MTAKCSRPHKGHTNATSTVINTTETQRKHETHMPAPGTACSYGRNAMWRSFPSAQSGLLNGSRGAPRSPWFAPRSVLPTEEPGDYQEKMERKYHRHLTPNRLLNVLNLRIYLKGTFHYRILYSSKKTLFYTFFFNQCLLSLGTFAL